MKDQTSLDGTQTPETTAPVATATPTAEAPAINNLEQMLQGRFADIERKVAEQQQQDTPATPAEPETPATEKPEPQPEPEPETPATDPEPENEPAAEEEPIEGLEKMTPEIQERINKRIGKITAERKAAEERIEALRQENLELQAKLKNNGLSFDEAMAVTKAGLPPEYLSTDEAKVIADEQFLRAEAEWAWDNQDGAEIDGKVYSGQQMRRYYRDIKAKHEELMPKARSLITERLSQYQEDLKQARELRAKRARVQQAAKTTAKPAATATKPPPAPPPSATRRPPVSAPTTSKQPFDARSLLRDGVTPESLQAAMERSL